METKRCSGCGESFGCGRGDPSCWCAELPALPAAALENDTDCYCPRCLASRTSASARPGADAKPPSVD